MREKIVAGNWKMYGDLQAINLRLSALSEAEVSGCKVVVFPSYVYLNQAHSLLKNGRVEFGAQNMSEHDEGAYTGEVSSDMLKDFGCKWVLIGHSERRQYFKETDISLAAKIDKALESDLIPIFCVGETQSQHESKKTNEVIETQISAVLSNIVNVKLLPRLVVAYEPVWAIGTGLTATPDYANEVHGFIREKLSNIHDDCGESTSILYGGSVKPDNAKTLFEMPHIDGGLVGGASLNATQFLEIVQCIK